MRSVVAFVRIHNRKLVYKTIAIILAFSVVAAALILGAAYATGGGDDPTVPSPQQHELTVDIDGIGKVELSPPGNPTVVNWLPGRKYITYATATTVSFEAKKVDASSKWVFREWNVIRPSGTITVTSTTMQQLISGRVTVKAIFDEPAPDTDPDDWYELQTSVLPPDAQSAGCEVDPTGTTRHPKDSSVSLVPAAAGTWRFKEWQGTNAAEVVSSEDHHSIAMTANKSVSAVFENVEFTLTLKKEGKGDVTAPKLVGFKTTSPYDTASITASNNSAGWNFSQWKGDLTGNTNPKTGFLMDSNKTVTAVFTKSGVHSLTVTTPKGCKTRVTSSSTITGSNANPLPEGTTVLQLASAGDVALELLPADSPASTRLYFLKWAGDVTAQQETQNPVTISVSGSKSIRGVAGRAYKLNLRTIGQGSVAVTASPTSGALGDNVFVKGTEVTLTATPDLGYIFLRYIGSIKRTSDAVTKFKMDSTKWILARFSAATNPNPYVNIRSADVRLNQIVIVTNSDTPVSGNLTLTIKETGAPVQLVNETKGVGSYTFGFSIGNLVVDSTYRTLDATWTVNGKTYYDTASLNPSFKRLGSYKHSVYNQPQEADTTCQSVETTMLYITDGNCNWSTDEVSSTFAVRLDINGSGVAVDSGLIQWSSYDYSHCTTGRPVGATIENTYRQVESATPKCQGTTISNLTVARHKNSKIAFPCQTKIFIVGLGVNVFGTEKTVTDEGDFKKPDDINVKQFDNFNEDNGRCDVVANPITDLGNFETLKLNPTD